MTITPYLLDLLSRHFFLGEDLASPLTSTPYIGILNRMDIVYPYTWFEIDNIAHPSYTRQPFTPVIEPTLYYIHQEATIEFTRAASDWGQVYGLALYDNNTVGMGNQLFTFHFESGSPVWEVIPYYTILTSSRLTLPHTHFIINIQTDPRASPEGYSVVNGGTSIEYCKIIAEWIFNLHVVPYPRIYDVAIGYDADVNPNNWGRWTGIWHECGGTDYARIPMAASDWIVLDGEGVQNKDELVFTEAAVDTWGDISDVILYVHDTDTPAFWGHLASHEYIQEGEAFSIGEGKLKIRWQGDGL